MNDPKEFGGVLFFEYKCPRTRTADINQLRSGLQHLGRVEIVNTVFSLVSSYALPVILRAETQ